jgi:hypothetical protein
MDGIEKIKAGNRPVSEFRATFLRPSAANAVQRCNGDTAVHMRVREGVICLLRSLGSGTRLPVVAEVAVR